ncbi:MAG: alkaline phosphatase D family protein [Bacteroidota bacterium]
MKPILNLAYPLTLMVMFTLSSDIYTQQISQANGQNLNGYEEPYDLYQKELKPFYHGVASGDPLQDRVILWTRVTPTNPNAKVEVKWEISLQEDFSSLVRSGTLIASSEKDFTVKEDVTGLEAGTSYFYRFEALGKYSQIGRTKTLPRGDVDQVKLLIATCSNYEGGYYNAYKEMAKREADAVVHLGDYIYEYEPGHYAQKHLQKAGRTHRPKQEIISLSDYRQRYSLYRTDSMLQMVHAAHPFINIWDDHETANNSHMTGAENHQPEKEGEWEQRKAVAQQAYFEWLPIRDHEEKNIYRSFQFGDLLSLIMVDTRIIGRSEQVENSFSEAYLDESRSILGQEQENWLKSELTKNTQWKVIGNQVMVSPMDVSFFKFLGFRIPFYPGKVKNMDQWDGYPIARDRVLDYLQEEKVDNVIFLTGDDHASYAYDVVREKNWEAYKEGREAEAVELVTPSISSANFDEYLPKFYLNKLRRKFPQKNPHLKWFNLTEHGYISLDISKEASVANWNFVDTIDEVKEGARVAKTLTIKNKITKLNE